MMTFEWLKAANTFSEKKRLRDHLRLDTLSARTFDKLATKRFFSTYDVVV